MNSIAGRVILSSGWERCIIAFASGAVGALALAPIGAFPALLVPMCVAVWLLDGSSLRPRHPGGHARVATMRYAAIAGWWMGFGYFVAGLWWIGAALLVEADKFAWALPLAVLGLPAVLALFTAFGFMCAASIWPAGIGRIFVLAAAVSAAEWLRGTLFTGFPWNEWGMALGGNLVLGQIASVIGLHGLTIVAVVLFALPAAAFGKTETGRSFRLGPLVAACLGLVGLAGFGALRLSAGTTPDVKDVRLRIMQPDIAQDEKFRGDERAEIVGKYLALSDRATTPRTSGLADVTHVIWPESAFPFILSRDAEQLSRIGAALPVGTTLVTGAARVAEALPGETAPGQPRVRYMNAVQVIASGGTILSSYDKVHLVPFGEYVPFQTVLEKLGVQHLVHIPGGFTAGERRMALHVPGLPLVAPLICYEAIFSGEVMPQSASGARPGVMLNVTNDGWFGNTSGPYQHLAQARLRSIEEGLPLIRAANTGISAIIDPYGRILKQVPLGVADVLDGALPQPLPPTVFAQFPLVAVFSLWALCLLAGLALRRRA